jgi:hypothetical protein
VASGAALPCGNKCAFLKSQPCTPDWLNSHFRFSAHTRERWIWDCFIVGNAARMASNAGSDERGERLGFAMRKQMRVSEESAAHPWLAEQSFSLFGSCSRALRLGLSHRWQCGPHGVKCGQR